MVQKKVLNERSKQMLLGKVQPNSHVILDVFDGVVVFRQVEEVEISSEELEVLNIKKSAVLKEFGAAFFVTVF